MTTDAWIQIGLSAIASGAAVFLAVGRRVGRVETTVEMTAKAVSDHVAACTEEKRRIFGRLDEHGRELARHDERSEAFCDRLSRLEQQRTP